MTRKKNKNTPNKEHYLARAEKPQRPVPSAVASADTASKNTDSHHPHTEPLQREPFHEKSHRRPAPRIDWLQIYACTACVIALIASLISAKDFIDLLSARWASPIADANAQESGNPNQVTPANGASGGQANDTLLQATPGNNTPALEGNSSGSSDELIDEIASLAAELRTLLEEQHALLADFTEEATNRQNAINISQSQNQDNLAAIGIQLMLSLLVLFSHLWWLVRQRQVF